MCPRSTLHGRHGLLSHYVPALQKILVKFVNAYTAFGIFIDVWKTDVLYQPATGTRSAESTILLNATPLVVDHFTSLGCTLATDCSLEKELAAWIHSACAAFGKGELNHRPLVPALKFGDVGSTVYRRHIRRLSLVHMRFREVKRHATSALSFGSRPSRTFKTLYILCRT